MLATAALAVSRASAEDKAKPIRLGMIGAAIVPLSMEAVAHRGKLVAFPDFPNGKWKQTPALSEKSHGECLVFATGSGHKYVVEPG